MQQQKNTNLSITDYLDYNDYNELYAYYYYLILPIQLFIDIFNFYPYQMFIKLTQYVYIYFIHYFNDRLRKASQLKFVLKTAGVGQSSHSLSEVRISI